jgi:hypothetical protein
MKSRDQNFLRDILCCLLVSCLLHSPSLVHPSLCTMFCTSLWLHYHCAPLHAWPRPFLSEWDPVHLQLTEGRGCSQAYILSLVSRHAGGCSHDDGVLMMLLIRAGLGLREWEVRPSRQGTPRRRSRSPRRRRRCRPENSGSGCGRS